MEIVKALGSDGFPHLFLKVCWDVVGKDLLAAFQTFHDRDQWCKSLSATIMLILKKNGVVCIKDFRPISLMGCLYKLLTKTLAIRLKSSLRQITNCSLMANEIVDAMRRAN